MSPLYVVPSSNDGIIIVEMDADRHGHHIGKEASETVLFLGIRLRYTNSIIFY